MDQMVIQAHSISVSCAIEHSANFTCLLWVEDTKMGSVPGIPISSDTISFLFIIHVLSEFLLKKLGSFLCCGVPVAWAWIISEWQRHLEVAIMILLCFILRDLQQVTG